MKSPFEDHRCTFLCEEKHLQVCKKSRTHPPLLIHPRALQLYQRHDEVSVFSDPRSNSINGKGQKRNPLKIKKDRLWNDIMTTAQWGQIPGTTGMHRLAGSDADKLVRDWFVREAGAIGCTVTIDALGNIFAVLPGQNMQLAPIGIGSHLDTQPNGGRFDGILGVIGALEVLRTIKESGFQTFAPLAAIDWTNEEGARFTSGCTGSAAWSGHISQVDCQALSGSSEEITLSSELSRIGYLGPTAADFKVNPLSAHLELHIEQNSCLERDGQAIGIVNGVQGIRWYRVDVHGEQSHAGSTPMDHRADAYVATAKLVTLIDRLARAKGAFATVGVISTDHSSPNTIPGTAHFSIDIRHLRESTIDEIERAIRAEMNFLEEENKKLSFDMTRIWHSPAVRFDERLLGCLRTAADRKVGVGRTREMDSFAGHDSALTALQTPTAMIFVPSRDGISHAPEEFTSKDQCGDGVQVLLDGTLDYDVYLRRTFT